MAQRKGKSLGLSSLFTLTLLGGCAVRPALDRPPNIVLIMADDVGTEAFGCYGGTSYQTPRLDQLATAGVQFMHCHSQPLCTPSRVKIMTGRSNARNYVAFSVLDPRERTFAHHMRDAGYVTVVAGKWQLLAASHYREPIRGSGSTPSEAGFDRHCLWQVDQLGSRYWAPKLVEDGATRTGGDDDYGPDTTCDYLIRFFEEHRDRPFFAYYPMALAHDPFVPTPADSGADRSKSPDHFGSMVAAMDRNVGRLVDALERLDLAENTLLIFTSDNGTHRKIQSQRQGATVRGAKGQTIDAGTHVPLIVVQPGTTVSGTCDDLIDFSDFLPTLAEAAGIPLPVEPALDGRSFYPQIRGLAGTPRDTSTCYYHPRPLTRLKSRPIRFARNRRFKLYDDGSMFDVTEDPLERSPLDDGAGHREIRDQLQKALHAIPAREIEFRARTQ